MMPPSTHLRRGYRGLSLSEAKRKPTGQRISMAETQPPPRRGLRRVARFEAAEGVRQHESYVSSSLSYGYVYTTWFFGEEGAVLEVGC